MQILVPKPVCSMRQRLQIWRPSICEKWSAVPSPPLIGFASSTTFPKLFRKNTATWLPYAAKSITRYGYMLTPDVR